MEQNLFSLPQYEKLDISRFQRLFDTTFLSYKFFWFRALISAVEDGLDKVSYDWLINHMVADAWYMVREYRLNLGPRDNLEKLIKYSGDILGLKSSENHSTIISSIESCNDKQLKEIKEDITRNVPYRLLRPLLGYKDSDYQCSEKKLIEKINASDASLLYRFDFFPGLESIISIDPIWAEYIRINLDVIKGWTSFSLICYLQRKNPGVPGIPDKLSPPQKRDLSRVTDYWKAISELSPVFDIYADSLVSPSHISIDHFVPWSYVAHDELWNLSPTTRKINSSKSNSLPVWNEYFPKLSALEYESHQITEQYTGLKGIYEKCLERHVNSTDIKERLYRTGVDRETFTNNLEAILKPAYDAALNLGFGTWRYTGEHT